MKIFPVQMLPTYNRQAFRTNKINNNQSFITANPAAYNEVRPEAENYKANFLPSVNISFEGVKRNQSHFELKTIENLDCPCCGEVMMTPKQQRAFIKAVYGKKGKQLEEVLLSASRFYKPVEADAVERIITLTKTKPNLTLQEIVKQEAPRHRKPLEKKQMAIIEKLRRASKNLKPDSRADVNALLDDAVNKIKYSTDKDHFKRGDVITGLIEIEGKKSGNEPAFKNMHKIATELPSTHTNLDAFFVKFARKSEKDIAERLTKPAVVTTEHINPQSQEGSNSTDNYIPMCSSCNALRSDIPYTIWLKLHPEMKENLQNFINTIDGIIKKGKFSGVQYYDTYIDEVIRAFAHETNNELILKRPDNTPVDFSKKLEKEKKRLSPEEKVEKWYAESTALYEKANKLRELKKSLENDEEYKLIVDYVSLADKLECAKQDKKNKSTKLTVEKRRQESYSASYKKALKEETKQKKLEELKQRTEEQKIIVEEANSQYLKASQKVKDIQAEFDKVSSRITLPEQVQTQINLLRAHLNRMKELGIQIFEVEENTRNRFMIKQDIRFYESEINEREKTNFIKRDSIDFDSPENKKACKDYRKLKEQLSMIDSVDKDEFKKLFKKRSQKPDFILNYSRQIVMSQMKELIAGNEAAKWLYEEDAIQELRDTVALKELEYQEAYNEEEQLRDLRSQYNELKLKGSEDTIEDKIKVLEKRKAELDMKFGAIDIDKQISDTERKANELMARCSESYAKKG